MAIDRKTLFTAAGAAVMAFSMGAPLPVLIGAAGLAAATQAFFSWLFPSNPRPRPSTPPAPPPASEVFDELDGGRSDHHVEHNNNTEPDIIVLNTAPSYPPPYVAPGRLYPTLGDTRPDGNTLVDRTFVPASAGPSAPAVTSTFRQPAVPLPKKHVSTPPSVSTTTASITRPDGAKLVNAEIRPAAGAHTHQIGDKRPSDGATLVNKAFVAKKPSTQQPAARPPLTFSPAATASSQNSNSSRQTFLNHPTPSTPYQTPAPTTTRPDGATRVNTEIRSANTQHQTGETRPSDNATLVSRKFIPKK